MPARLRSWTTTRSLATAERRGSEGSAGSGLRQVESHNIPLVQNQEDSRPLRFPPDKGGRDD